MPIKLSVSRNITIFALDIRLNDAKMPSFSDISKFFNNKPTNNCYNI